MLYTIFDNMNFEYNYYYQLSEFDFEKLITN